MQQLAQMAQVGQLPLAIGPAQHAGVQVLVGGDGGLQGRHPVPAQQHSPTGQRLVEGVPLEVVGPMTRSASHPQNTVSAAAATADRELDRSMASSSRNHSRATAVANTLPTWLITAGTPAARRASHSAAWRGCACGPARAIWPGVISLSPANRRTTSLARSPATISRARSTDRRAGQIAGRKSLHHAHAQRCAVGAPADAGPPMGGRLEGW